MIHPKVSAEQAPGVLELTPAALQGHLQGLTEMLRCSLQGRVREATERAAVMADRVTLDVADLDQTLRLEAAGVAPTLRNGVEEFWPRRLREAERDLILRTLQSVDGNRTQAADILGISRQGLHQKLKHLKPQGIPEPTRRGNGAGETGGTGKFVRGQA